MIRCIELAEKGLGRVAPNPMVGSLIVHDGMIIAEGYHQIFGGPHAEVNAINALKNKDLLKESTLFVNLEPCAHFGKTPPCADLIISSKIPKVVVAQRDPNPKVAGRGIERMQAAGIEVIEGICEAEAEFLNRRFLMHQRKNRPYIILKWAQSADGFMDRDRNVADDPKINWISNPATKKLVHLWRSQEQAILVGRNTIINDNPRLDTREVAGASPLRVVLSNSGNLPNDSNVLTDGNSTLIYNSRIAKKNGNAEWIKFENDLLENALSDLSEKGISSVLVEGGAETLNTFIANNLWDEARIIQSENRLDSGLKAPEINSPTGITETYGKDQITRVYKK
ncbi:bifunctional diaminohydroxyphosphoribosylaminopyrimidine deaminase/5-amino-6-(5-phosphoribosylamino)uracil reductase RibD [Cryomorpha ignava]|uniref:Riboflavin biosynthesis protein RibD n=1 Tax=Cryomorpha ignava TaxID=101383 RepID=A0A7K3WTU1_9FLAO|nr:bifunctional diaminohydroxyphosphoribosylaminopyrimidine deaminase/5-amino-6-(5-phosphoribosylamino)uracil reductase RibD [Cryomorpha ignava]NEN24968.1 bifunctional diaminohydroxyphosphoribosylaminopyrimidine deaminase/5-amino-6-(5-phosphoribosylamino)uracil reductase RibD [Cryomorpha ignava]